MQLSAGVLCYGVLQTIQRTADARWPYRGQGMGGRAVEEPINEEKASDAPRQSLGKRSRK